MWSRRKGNKLEYAGYSVKKKAVRKLAGRAAFLSKKLGCQKDALHQPNTICGFASLLANTHICVSLAPKGLLTP